MKKYKIAVPVREGIVWLTVRARDLIRAREEADDVMETLHA